MKVQIVSFSYSTGDNPLAYHTWTVPSPLIWTVKLKHLYPDTPIAGNRLFPSPWLVSPLWNSYQASNKMADEDRAKKSATHRVKSLVSLFGLIFTVITFVCFMIGFSSPNWIEHFNKYTERQFVKMGLWEVCFKQWSYYKDYLGKKYNGCWWIFSFEYRPVWSWLNPCK